MIFREFGTFTRRLAEYMDDEEHRQLQNLLLVDPSAGDVMRGTGGVRKLRRAGPDVESAMASGSSTTGRRADRCFS